MSVSLRAEFETRTWRQVVYLGGVVDAGCTIRSPLRNEVLIPYLLGAWWLRALGCQGCPSCPNTGWPQLPRPTQFKVTLISGGAYIQWQMEARVQSPSPFSGWVWSWRHHLSFKTSLRVSGGWPGASSLFLPLHRWCWFLEPSVMSLTHVYSYLAWSGVGDSRMGFRSWIITAWLAARVVLLMVGGAVQALTWDLGGIPSGNDGLAGAVYQHLRNKG